MYYISADYIAALLAFAAESGIATAKCIHADYMPQVLSGQQPWYVMEETINRLLAIHADPTLGLQFGLTLGISSHGLSAMPLKARKPC